MTVATMTPDKVAIEGTVAQGWGPVRDAFIENFELRGEVGAACAIYKDGESILRAPSGTHHGAADLPGTGRGGSWS